MKEVAGGGPTAAVDGGGVPDRMEGRCVSSKGRGNPVRSGGSVGHVGRRGIATSRKRCRVDPGGGVAIISWDGRARRASCSVAYPPLIGVEARGFGLWLRWLFPRVSPRYSHDQNYWRITDFFTNSSNRPTHASNSMVWGISPQPGHFFSFQLAHFVGHALPHPRKQTPIDRGQNSARQTHKGNCR